VFCFFSFKSSCLFLTHFSNIELNPRLSSVPDHTSTASNPVWTNSKMSTNKRIMKELGEVQSNPPEGVTITLPNEGDFNVWHAKVSGPPDSVYAGGAFNIEIVLPKEYPFKPPRLGFKTKIYHPNVTNDENGAMCLGMLRSDEWKPPNKIAEVLKLVRAVMAAPQPEDSVEPAIADQFNNNRQEFDKIAKEWVNKYAQ